MAKMDDRPQAAGREALPSHPWVFYFDDDCCFCARIVGWLSRIDIFRRVGWVPFRTLEEPPPGLTWEDLDRAAYLTTGRGRTHQGFYGIRMLTLRLLLLVPFAPLFWLPGIDRLCVPLYRWIAGNRCRIPVCRPQALKSANRRKGVD